MTDAAGKHPSFPCDGASPFRLTQGQPSVCIESGTVNVFVRETGPQGLGRRHYLCSCDAGGMVTDIPGLDKEGLVLELEGDAGTQLSLPLAADGAGQPLPSWSQHLAEFPDGSAVSRWVRAAQVADETVLLERTEMDQERFSGSFARLAATVGRQQGPPGAGPHGRDLAAAFERTLSLTGIALPDGAKIPVADDPFEMAEQLGIRTRRIRLAGEWWKKDGEPMMGWVKDLGYVPIAFREGSYHLAGPAPRLWTPVDATNAAKFSAVACQFYRRFERPKVGLAEILRIGLQGRFADLRTILWMGLAGGLLAVLVPVFLGELVDQVVPQADRGRLLFLALALAMSAFGGGAFLLVQSLAMLRLESAMEASVQPAVWDRLLRLPADFFRGFSAGDLGQRAMGIDSIQKILSGMALRTVLAGLFSVLNLLVMFKVDGGMAAKAAGLVAFAALVTAVSGWFKVVYQRQLADLEGKMAGLVLEIIQGVEKIRVAGAEQRAFSLWVDRFTKQKEMRLKVGQIDNLLTVFNQGFPVLAQALVFVLVVAFNMKAALAGRTGPLKTGEFLAFNAAFTAFLAAVVSTSGELMNVLKVLPLYERAKPILHSEMEGGQGGNEKVELQGGLEVTGVSFRYEAGGPEILDNVSISAAPGEFIALVGCSGSGKSTLLRIILGFEWPENGSVHFDGKDLKELELRHLRKQLGVVLQNGIVLPGDIYGNIAGVSPITEEQAWAAARDAGLADDIAAMPMGMQTLLNHGGSVLSGGQRQRLIIARALAARPKVVLFDEATSALDNRTQSVVSESLERLKTTRIVIAHRLSTIQKADRIYVLQDGKIVQTGDYSSLMKVDGIFKELARRQIA